MFFKVSDLSENLGGGGEPLLLEMHPYCIHMISAYGFGVRTPPAAVGGPPGGVGAGSTLTCLENGSGGEWIRLRDQENTAGFSRASSLPSHGRSHGLSRPLPRTPSWAHPAHTHSPAQVLCRGPGLGAEVAVTDLLLDQVFHPVVHL